MSEHLYQIKQYAHRLCVIALLCLIAPTFAAWEEMDEEEYLSIVTSKFTEGKYSAKGADNCLMCHRRSDKVMALFAGVHGRTGTDASPMSPNQLQCEACHGPMGNHNRGGKEPVLTFGVDSPLPAEAQNSVCLSCHQGDERLAWHGSTHDIEAVPCSQCHEIHAEHDPSRDQQAANDNCLTCHQQQKAQIHQRSSHPVRTGQLNCTDCHNPHGTLNTAMLPQVSLNDNCYSCHADKRGPFLWEHTPVAEDCSTCHDAHGSVNEAMLTSRLPLLCQSCHASVHSGTPVFQPGQDPFGGGRSCLNCHNMVHGSNHPSGKLLQR
ncbi:DmsE family decaheme c-type cytochrome [Ferrimonas pelagia]|uniref:DmsE family decaheme c-type cytochrome n=1 Tax=Ferrimonas pelagia TaxID=1177826 RepID=A0ABP9EHG7_9GAMM